MPRYTISNKGRAVGSLEVESSLLPPTVVLPGFDGDQAGLAFVLELDDIPVAALVFALDADSIELSSPFQWFSDVDVSPGRERLATRSMLSAALSLLDLEGELVAPHETMQFALAFTQALPPGNSFGLAIHDEVQQLHVDCATSGMDGTLRARLRARIRSSTSEEGAADADYSFELHGDIFGSVELRGYFRSMSEGQSRSVNYVFDSFGVGHGHGTGRFRGDISTFPILAFMQQTLDRVASRGNPIRFRIWVGTVRYTTESPEARVARQRVAEVLALQSPTVSDFGLVTEWLFDKCSSDPQFASALRPLVGPSELADIGHMVYRGPAAEFAKMFKRGLSPEQFAKMSERASSTEVDISFDESVSSEKALRFLIALSQELADAGGTLCFASRRRTSESSS